MPATTPATPALEDSPSVGPQFNSKHADAPLTSNIHLPSPSPPKPHPFAPPSPPQAPLHAHPLLPTRCMTPLAAWQALPARSPACSAAPPPAPVTSTPAAVDTQTRATLGSTPTPSVSILLSYLPRPFCAIEITSRSALTHASVPQTKRRERFLGHCGERISCESAKRRNAAHTRAQSQSHVPRRRILPRCISRFTERPK